MGQALTEFRARISDLQSDLAFVDAAFRFRPYVYAVLNREADVNQQQLAQTFANVKDSRPAGLYGPLAVRLAACLERYLRSLMQESVTLWASQSKSYADLPESLAKKNIVLTGKLLAYSETPRDHLKIDVADLIKNLASCIGTNKQFALNPQGFATLVSGISDDALAECIEALKVGEFWNSVCGDDNLKKILGETRTSDASKSTKQKLKDLSRWRNNWAHGGDDETVLDADQLRNLCLLLSRFVEVLDKFIAIRIKSHASRTK